MDFKTWIQTAAHPKFDIEVEEKLWSGGIKVYFQLSGEDQKVLKQQYKKYRNDH